MSNTPVLDLLRDPAKWCRGALARDAQGNAVGYSEPSAAAFCMVGAVYRCYPGPRFHAARAKLRKVVPLAATFNDNPETTHADVIRVLEKAQV